MSRFEYETKMAYAQFMCKILGIVQFYQMTVYKELQDPEGFYGWVVSQCGFCYVGSWEQCQAFYEDKQ